MTRNVAMISLILLTLSMNCSSGDSTRNCGLLELLVNDVPAAPSDEGLELTPTRDVVTTSDEYVTTDPGASDVVTSDALGGLYDCCDEKSPCRSDLVCARGYLASSGACVLPAPPPGCWRDVDCGPSRFCSVTLPGSFTPDCKVPTGPGTCLEQVPFGACCAYSNAACSPFDQECAPSTDGPGARCVALPRPQTGPGGASYCFSDQYCGQYSTCEGASICGCERECDPRSIRPGFCKLKPSLGCCFDDAECDPSQDCIKGSDRGVCMFRPKDGCFDNSDCPEGTWCSGAMIVGCILADQNEEGSCVARPSLGQCCNHVSGCAEGLVCSAQVCVLLESDECLAPTDCPLGKVCTVAFDTYDGSEPWSWPCKPGDDYWTPELGHCTAATEGSCCDKSTGCGPGLVCVPATATQVYGVWTKGTCVQPLPEGMCWSDDDCDPAGRCTGQQICACEGSTFCASQPGTCLKAGSVAGACCRPDGTCGDGLKCLDRIDLVCAAEPQPGHCWEIGDCPLGTICTGAFLPSFCGANEDLGYQGICTLPDLADKGDVCGPSRPCKAGLNLVCVQVGDCTPTQSGADCRPHSAGTCQIPAPAGRCWSDVDCENLPYGEHCQDSTLCDGDHAPCPEAMPGKCIAGAGVN